MYFLYAICSAGFRMKAELLFFVAPFLTAGGEQTTDDSTGYDADELAEVDFDWQLSLSSNLTL